MRKLTILQIMTFATGPHDPLLVNPDFDKNIK